jgi:hypothetical protein
MDSSDLKKTTTVVKHVPDVPADLVTDEKKTTPKSTATIKDTIPVLLDDKQQQASSTTYVTATTNAPAHDSSKHDDDEKQKQPPPSRKRRRTSDEVLPVLFPDSIVSTSGRPVRASRLKIHTRYYGKIVRCVKYPDGVYINKHGEAVVKNRYRLPKIDKKVTLLPRTEWHMLTTAERNEQKNLLYDKLVKIEDMLRNKQRKRRKLREEARRDGGVGGGETASSDDTELENISQQLALLEEVDKGVNDLDDDDDDEDDSDEYVNDEDDEEDDDDEEDSDEEEEEEEEEEDEEQEVDDEDDYEDEDDDYVDDH